MVFKNNTFSLLIATAIFLAPINLFIKWGESQAYVSGIFSDYLVQKFWLAEIPVILTILIWLISKIQQKNKKILPWLKKNIAWLIGLITLGIYQFYSPLPKVSVWYFTTALSLIIFGFCLADLKNKLNLHLIKYALLITIIFQATLATVQFFRQQSLFEYAILGETQLTSSINIAQAEFKTGLKILPYGTTAHPNILAGIMVVLGALWLELSTQYKQKIDKQYFWLIALISWILFLTQSVSAILAFIFFIFMHNFSQFKKYFLPLALCLIIAAPLLLMLLTGTIDNQSVYRRALLNAHAASVIAQNPWFGAGLDSFTVTLKNITGDSSSQFIRFIQPAHNVLLLFLAETGLLGAATVWVSLKNINWRDHASWLLMLVPIMSLDHYVLTQWVGGIMLVLLATLSVQPRYRRTKKIN